MITLSALCADRLHKFRKVEFTPLCTTMREVCPLKQLLFLLSGFKPLGITPMWFWYDCTCKKAKPNKLGQLLNSVSLKPLGILFKQGVQNLTQMETSFSSNTGWSQPPTQTSDLPCRSCSTPGHSSSTTQICTEGEDISCACSHLQNSNRMALVLGKHLEMLIYN